ncbi:MAG: hypothetical protein Q9198_001210 [Flavoplaca austrocitrina]
MEPGFCLDESSGVNNATTGKFNPRFRALWPWVTTVGGTQRTIQPHQNFTTKTAATIRTSTSVEDPENPINETVFCFATDNRTLSSGGGFSNLFPALYYLERVSKISLEASTHGTIGGKAQSIYIADIDRYELTESEHLRNLTGIFTTTSRGYPVIHGTSGSTPVFASIISMINNERTRIGKASVGFIKPVL